MTQAEACSSPDSTDLKQKEADELDSVQAVAGRGADEASSSDRETHSGPTTPSSQTPATLLPDSPVKGQELRPPVPAKVHPAFADTLTEPPPFEPGPGYVPFYPLHPDPTPWLHEGVWQAPQGPRLNPSPPPPRSMPPALGENGIPVLPPPQPPQLMTFTAPPLRSGHPISPSEGERVTKYTYCHQDRSWHKYETRVRIDLYPFQEGSLRSVFFMKDFSYPQGPPQDFVAKISKDPEEPIESYFEDCEMQALAAFYAEEYCQLGVPKLVSYVQAAVIECHDREPTRPGGRVLFSIEPFVYGLFIKYTNNYGWVNPGAPRHTPQAFSHFTWCHSGGKLLVVDVQGVVDHCGVDRYTDPQIHSAGPVAQFGKADLQKSGIQAFFGTHQCNDVCALLKLPRGMDLGEGWQPPPRVPPVIPPPPVLPPPPVPFPQMYAPPWGMPMMPFDPRMTPPMPPYPAHRGRGKGFLAALHPYSGPPPPQMQMMPPPPMAPMMPPMPPASSPNMFPMFRGLFGSRGSKTKGSEKGGKGRHRPRAPPKEDPAPSFEDPS